MLTTQKANACTAWNPCFTLLHDQISKAAFARFLSKSANAVLKVYVESYESFSRSEMNNKNEQRGDFIQDENNKMIKSFSPPGMPSAEIWHRVCRKATSHKKIKLSVCDAPDVKKKFSIKDI